MQSKPKPPPVSFGVLCKRFALAVLALCGAWALFVGVGFFVTTAALAVGWLAGLL